MRTTHMRITADAEKIWTSRFQLKNLYYEKKTKEKNVYTHGQETW